MERRNFFQTLVGIGLGVKQAPKVLGSMKTPIKLRPTIEELPRFECSQVYFVTNVPPNCMPPIGDPSQTKV